MSPKRDSIWVGVSITGFLILSTSFLLMGAYDNEMITMVAGIMFWLGLLLGVLFQILLATHIRKTTVKNRTCRGTKRRAMIGIFSLFSNPVAIIFDLLMVVSLAGLIISIISTGGMEYICYVFLATTVFTFCMHCIFNGRIYFYVSNKGGTLK